MLSDAAVVGHRFWDGALGALGDDRVIERGLRRLSALKLIRPAETSSMSGQREFVFWHGLRGTWPTGS